jgi:hypothetical protein
MARLAHLRPNLVWETHDDGAHETTQEGLLADNEGYAPVIEAVKYLRRKTRARGFKWAGVCFGGGASDETFITVRLASAALPPERSLHRYCTFYTDIPSVAKMLEEDDGREANPSSWGAHHDTYYSHPSVRDHVALRITAKGRDALAKRRGTPAALRVLALLADTPSLPQFVIEGEFGIGHAVLSPLLDAGLISAAIETKPHRPIARSYADEDFDLEYQHREMLRRGRPYR